jgi:superfamily II DNA helicase RecQ
VPVLFFTIPIRDPQPATDELNRFLAQHRIWQIEHKLIECGLKSVWSVCVNYGFTPPGPARGGRGHGGDGNGRVDYRDVLSEPQFAQFARLRKLRKTLAEQERVPAYAVATNEQLANMVRNEARTLADIAQIEGIGETRATKYGVRFLEELQQARAAAECGSAVPSAPAGAGGA